MRAEDFSTECWKRLAARVTSRIDELRKSNDQENPIEKTAWTRGGISELKKILALADKASAIHAVHPDPFGVDLVPPAHQGE